MQIGVLQGDSATPLPAGAADGGSADDDQRAVEWDDVMQRLGEVFDEVEAAAGRAGDAAAEAEVDRQAWEERAEAAVAHKAEVRRRAEAMAAKMEDTLMEVEARLAEARAKWDREEDAGRRRREEDRELMLEQVWSCPPARAPARATPARTPARNACLPARTRARVACVRCVRARLYWV